MTKTTSSTIRELSKVWTPDAEWELHEAPGKPVFLFPAFGKGNYNNVVAQVLENRVNLPTGEQSAFMLDEAYNSTDEDVKESQRSKFVRDDIMYKGWLWVTNVNVWTPEANKNPGMYSVFDENGEGLDRKYTLEELEDRLSGGDTEKGVRFSQDRTVAFAPRNTYSSGEHKKGTLSQDGAFIANYWVEGAEALDRVAEQFRFNPYSWIVDNDTNELIQTLSALDRDRNLNVNRLDAYFNSNGNSRNGYVVSVSGSENSAEGTAPKK